jgi:hypothetical protein
MSWILLATPTLGILAVIAALWIGHRLVPLERVPAQDSDPTSIDYDRLVQKTAAVVGKRIIALLQDSLDKLTPAKTPVGHDQSSEFPQFGKPTSMSFEGPLEVDLGNVPPATPTADERSNVARRTIRPRQPSWVRPGRTPGQKLLLSLLQMHSFRRPQ